VPELGHTDRRSFLPSQTVLDNALYKRELRNWAAATYAAMVAVHTEVPGERHRAALALIDALLAVPSAMPTLTLPTSDSSEVGSHAAPGGRELPSTPTDPATRPFLTSQ
jgi:hypothetical protein